MFLLLHRTWRHFTTTSPALRPPRELNARLEFCLVLLKKIDESVTRNEGYGVAISLGSPGAIPGANSLACPGTGTLWNRLEAECRSRNEADKVSENALHKAWPVKKRPGEPDGTHTCENSDKSTVRHLHTASSLHASVTASKAPTLDNVQIFLGSKREGQHLAYRFFTRCPLNFHYRAERL